MSIGGIERRKGYIDISRGLGLRSDVVGHGSQVLVLFDFEPYDGLGVDRVVINTHYFFIRSGVRFQIGGAHSHEFSDVEARIIFPKNKARILIVAPLVGGRHKYFREGLAISHKGVTCAKNSVVVESVARG